MVSGVAHVAPANRTGSDGEARAIDGPPSAATFRRRPPRAKAIQRPSGDTTGQRGALTPSMVRDSSASLSRTRSMGTPFLMVA